MYTIGGNWHSVCCDERMKAPLVTLLPVLAFALYPLERASAIAISSPSIGTFVESYAHSAGNPNRDLDHRSGWGLPVAATTSPLNLGPTVAAVLRNFVNSPTQAIWSGAQTFINLGAVSPFASGAGAYGEFRFLLSETVNYSVTSNFIAGLNDGATARSFARLEKRGEPDFQFKNVYLESDQTTGIIRLGDGVGALVGTNTGILEPGSYLFSFGAEINGGNGGTANGNFSFALTRSVPDAGSTLTLLGLAVCAIGGIFRKVNRA